MQRSTVTRIAFLAGGFLAAWLFLRYLLPIFLPFGIGFLLALSAEPAVGLLTRAKLPRWAATGLGVSLTLILLITLIWVVGDFCKGTKRTGRKASRFAKHRPADLPTAAGNFGKHG